MILYDEISRCGNAAGPCQCLHLAVAAQYRRIHTLCVVHHTRSSAVNAALTNGPAIAISALWRFGDKHLKVLCAPVHVPVHDAVLNTLVLTSRVRCRTSTSKMSSWAAVFAHWRFRSRARAAMLQVCREGNMGVFVVLGCLFKWLKRDGTGLTCSAKREGAEWVVTGNKKWITNGM